MRRPRFAFAGFVALTFSMASAVACTESSEDAAPPATASGLTVEPIADGYQLSLAQAAFDRQFLLLPAFTEALPSFLPYALDGLIVRFEKRANSVALLRDEAMAPMQKLGVPFVDLVAEFPILSQDSDSGMVSVDFDAGIQNFAREAMAASGGGALSAAFVASAYVKDDALYVDQAVSSAASAAVEADGEAVKIGHLHYTLQPYVANPAFVPQEGSELFDLRRAGYFMNPPLFSDGSALGKRHALRWDLTKPIVWTISANAPADVRQTIKEGILYWNKVAGRDIITIDDTPDTRAAVEPGHNMVQWISNDTLSFAYAQFRADPLTGEIKQGFVVLPSAWLVTGRDEFAEHTQSVASAHSGRHAQSICNLALDAGQKRALRGAFLELPADALGRASHDLLRTIVAHEIGHTLGLRHNFAAKASYGGTGAEYAAQIETYLKTGDAGTGIFSSSVMDYAPLLADAVIGAQMKAGLYVGRHDTEALAWGYGGKATAAVDGGLFCTDDDTGFDTQIDCERFIAPGRTAFVALGHLATLSKSAARGLAALYRGKLAPINARGRGAERVALDPLSDASTLAATELRQLARLLHDAKGSPSQFLTKLRQMSVIDALNIDEFHDAERAHQAELLVALGGVKAVLAPFVPKRRDDGSFSSDAMLGAQAEFERLIDLPQYRSGTNASGVAYAFTDADIAVMRTRSIDYFRRLDAALLNQVVAALTDINFGAGPPPGAGEPSLPPSGGSTNFVFMPSILPTELGPALAELATAIVTAEDSVRLTQTGDGFTVDVANAYFDSALRQQALKLLSHDLLDLTPRTFNEGAGAAVRIYLETRKAAIDGDDPTRLELLSRELYREALEVQGLIDGVDAADPEVPADEEPVDP